MANATVTQLVNRSTVAAALQAARVEAAQHAAWMNAINRAALNLEACPWQFDGEVLIIASATAGGTRYTVDAQGCGCRAHAAGRPCWHRAARRLLIKAAEMAQPAAPVGVVYKGQYYTAAQLERSRAARMERAQAAADELFAA